MNPSTYSDLFLMAQALAFKAGLAVLGVICVLGVLHQFEKRYGVDTYSWVKDASDVAKALYFGLQFLGVCLLFGFIFT